MSAIMWALVLVLVLASLRWLLVQYICRRYGHMWEHTTTGHRCLRCGDTLEIS